MNMGSYSDKENNKSIKREAAEARQKEYDALSISERIAKIDAKFGVGQGGTKERAKLAKRSSSPQKRVEVKVKLPEPQEQVSVPVSIDDQLQRSGYDPLTGMPETK
jgi:hypothetical protein